MRRRIYFPVAYFLPFIAFLLAVTPEASAQELLCPQRHARASPMHESVVLPTPFLKLSFPFTSLSSLHTYTHLNPSLPLPDALPIVVDGIQLSDHQKGPPHYIVGSTTPLIGNPDSTHQTLPMGTPANTPTTSPFLGSSTQIGGGSGSGLWMAGPLQAGSGILSPSNSGVCLVSADGQVYQSRGASANYYQQHTLTGAANNVSPRNSGTPTTTPTFYGSPLTKSLSGARVYSASCSVDNANSPCRPASVVGSVRGVSGAATPRVGGEDLRKSVSRQNSDEELKSRQLKLKGQKRSRCSCHC